MKLSKKHIGGLFVNRGYDGSWVYQLVDVKKGWLLFYNFGSMNTPYWKEKAGKYTDWIKFEPVIPWPSRWLEWGWRDAKEIK